MVVALSIARKWELSALILIDLETQTERGRITLPWSSRPHRVSVAFPLVALGHAGGEVSIIDLRSGMGLSPSLLPSLPLCSPLPTI